MGRARRAAAAAAALREPVLESRRWPEKAESAADAAEGSAADEFSGCYVCVRLEVSSLVWPRGAE